MPATSPWPLGHLLTLALLISGLSGTPAYAQGVLFSLPPEGTWVRYEGTYQQNEIRPASTVGKLEIPPWAERVWIKALGTETADFEGESTECRWIEIKIERGREVEGTIDPGLTGLQIYKVLVPVKAITGELISEQGVPVNHVPIARGYRQFGQQEAKALPPGALQLYPLALVVGYYRNTQVVNANASLTTGLGSLTAEEIHGTTSLERASSRTQQETIVWRSSEVPFGLAAWSARITRETKDDRQPRDKFAPVTEVLVDMKAQETGSDATSDLPTAN